MKDKPSRGKKSKLRENVESVIYALVIAVFVRAFFVQAYKIPSGSMIPTLLIGDHILVNRLAYGLRIPYTKKKFFPRHPKRGDIVVFVFPLDRSKDFIKRVIAVGGETVEVKGEDIYINGKRIRDPWGHYYTGMSKEIHFGPTKVPKGYIFVMGDNRDNSYDSRFWGFVDERDVKGKPMFIYFSWDSKADLLHKVRWSRIGRWVR